MILEMVIPFLKFFISSPVLILFVAIGFTSFIKSKLS